MYSADLIRWEPAEGAGGALSLEGETIHPDGSVTSAWKLVPESPVELYFRLHAVSTPQ